MSIQPDKLQHMKAGLFVSLAAGAAWLAFAWLGVATLGDGGPAMFLAGLVAGVTKEVADWFDNKASPGMHGVEALDCIATALPGAAAWLLCAALSS